MAVSKAGAISFGILPENEVGNIVKPGVKVKNAAGEFETKPPLC
jgi:hypothetical protein